MGTDMTIYTKATMSTESLCDVIKKELGIKSCMPFADRVMVTLNECRKKNEKDEKTGQWVKRDITQDEGKLIINKLLDNLQTLAMGGTVTEDYDKIDIVKRGGMVTLSLRVEGLIRAAARKGYRIVDTTVSVPKDSKIYFDEVVQGNNILYVLKDDHKNTDREITAERLLNGYFDKFLCRLEIRDAKSNQIVAITTTEMSNAEIMAVHNSSERGIYKSEWVYNEKTKKQNKVIYDGKDGRKTEFDKESFWVKWTGEMVRKTVLRRALKKVREALPELERTFYAFEEQPIITADPIPPEKTLELPDIKVENVDLNKLTDEQKKEAEETLSIYKANPAVATQDANKIMHDFFENGKSAQELVNAHYAELANLMKGNTTLSIIQPLLDDLKGSVK